MSAPPSLHLLPLDRARIAAALSPETCIGRDVRVLSETDSTNDLARRAGESGAAEGLVFFAERQRAGRGRRGRAWDSRAGLGLWFSVLLRPAAPRARWPRLSLLTALAVLRGIEQAVPELRLSWKWPNDLESEGRKVAGLLIETQADFAVIGIGINARHSLNDFPPELRPRATSLSLLAGHLIDREAVAAAVLGELDRLWQLDWAGPVFSGLVAELTLRSSLLGCRVRVSAGLREITGVAEMLDTEGQLGLLLDDGMRVRVDSGEVEMCRVENAV